MLVLCFINTGIYSIPSSFLKQYETQKRSPPQFSFGRDERFKVSVRLALTARRFKVHQQGHFGQGCWKIQAFSHRNLPWRFYAACIFAVALPICKYRKPRYHCEPRNCLRAGMKWAQTWSESHGNLSIRYGFQLWMQPSFVVPCWRLGSVGLPLGRSFFFLSIQGLTRPPTAFKHINKQKNTSKDGQVSVWCLEHGWPIFQYPWVEGIVWLPVASQSGLMQHWVPN